MGGGGGAAYTSTKHAVIGYTRQLAAGYGKQGIRANAIAPGLIDTPMVADISHTEETTTWLGTQEQSSRLVDEDLLGGFGLRRFVGSFDELAVDEHRAGTHECNQMGCVDCSPAVLCGLDELERHR
jgi:NAD(P)-dependent dehydrogenase (short-subunit alcohol dehydrogenase family)